VVVKSGAREELRRRNLSVATAIGVEQLPVDPSSLVGEEEFDQIGTVLGLPQAGL